MTSTESTTVTMTAACEMGRCGSCRGTVLSLTDGHLADCACSHHHDDEPAEEEDGGLDAYVDLMVERELEDLHFAEGWS